MYYLFRKEINGFFSSLTGYIVIIAFIALTGLPLWFFGGDPNLPKGGSGMFLGIFKGTLNILDGGYASLDSLFILAPLVFLMLIPAITMRMFAEERRSGTLDLLLTRPLTETRIILAKFFAALFLVFLSLLPTLIYYISVVLLGNPVNNLDVGGTWGSYIGLFFLAAGYAIIGLFCSSLTDNVIVAFLLAVAVCLFIGFGLDEVGEMGGLNSIGEFLQNLGIAEHYKSMSRGVIDSRDVVYFLALIALFVLLTRYMLERRKW